MTNDELKNLLEAIDTDTRQRAEWLEDNGVDAVTAAETALLNAGGFTPDDVENVKEAFAKTLT